MGVNITAKELFDGAFSFAKDCLQNKRSMQEQLDYSNGESTVLFHNITFKKDITLYWSCIIQTIKYELQNPASSFFILGYNEKATELGMPLYNSFDIIIKCIYLLVIKHIIKDRSTF